MLGDKGREDRELTDLLDKLRSNANWAGLHPRNRRSRARFQRKLDVYVEDAAPGSLVETLMLSTLLHDSRIRDDLLATGRLPTIFDHATPRMGFWRA